MAGVVLPELEPLDGGWRVGEIDGAQVCVLKMMFNYRVVLGDDTGYWKFWCYYGTGPVEMLRAVAAAQTWILSGGDEPAGWDKNGQTRQYRKGMVS